uniref:Peroxidase n=1 Tax=Rhizophora mucronata TaxID=61149 RepID=A0A2P2LJ99_RHIMU
MRLPSVKMGLGKSLPLAAEKLAVLESLLPSLTSQYGPPRRTVDSRAAMAMISAHDTTPGHTFSTSDFIRSITANPLRELLFGPAVCSPMKVAVSASSMEPSQPCYNQ